MKYLYVLFSVVLLFSTPSRADQFINGYTRSNGTYVAPHMRSDPDGNPNNNWSTKGNVNPYTGQQGTKSVQPVKNNNYGYPSNSGQGSDE